VGSIGGAVAVLRGRRSLPARDVNQVRPGLEAVPRDRSAAATATGTRLDVSTNGSALVVEQLSKRFGTHVAAFEVDYGELLPRPERARQDDGRAQDLAMRFKRANCARNCGTWSQLPQSSSVSDRSRRSLAISVCRQGVRFAATFWRSTLMSANTEFTNEGSGASGIRTPDPLPARQNQVCHSVSWTAV
jgi:hypothetical protein